MLKRLQEARKNEKGFTLIELLIVIVILGILAAIVVFAVNGITNKGTDSACKSDLKTVEVASEAYYAQKGSYATDIQALVDAGLLREKPSTKNYTINYSTTGGTVSSPACKL
jgi:type II secretion system protein G